MRLLQTDRYHLGYAEGWSNVKDVSENTTVKGFHCSVSERREGGARRTQRKDLVENPNDVRASQFRISGDIHLISLR